MVRRRLSPSLHVPAGLLALSPMAAANTQLVTGFIQTPHNLEQCFGVIVVGILVVLAIRTMPGRGIMPPAAAAASVVLLAVYSAQVFKANASVWQRTPPPAELLDALRNNPDSLLIADANLADVLGLIAPRLHFSALARSQTVSPASSSGREIGERWANYLCVKHLAAAASDSALRLRDQFEALDRSYLYLNQDFPLVHLNRPVLLTKKVDASAPPRGCAPRPLLIFPAVVLGRDHGSVPVPSTIETSVRRWEYADRRPLPATLAEGDLTDAQARLTVTRGCVSVGVLTPDGRRFITDASLTAAPSIQRVDLVFEPERGTHSFVVSNCSPDGASTATIQSVHVFSVAKVTVRRLEP
jgi:hypothetical protein